MMGNSGGIVVEHSTTDLDIKGSNLASNYSPPGEK